MANSSMKTLLAQEPSAVSVPPQLLFLFMGGFKDVEGCTFFRRLFHRDNLGPLGIRHDLTGYEADVNKVFVEDYLEPDAARELPSLAATAVISARDLAERLKSARPQFSFKIVVSASETGSKKRPASAALRFYRVRENESWLAPNIEGYEEAVAVLDTGPT